MENNRGFIKLSRKVFADKLWKIERTFSEWEAWVDLIQSARFEPSLQTLQTRSCSVASAMVELNRGQLIGSGRYLANRWNWSEKRVRGFLSYLRKNEMIKTESVSGATVITLINYDKYNDLKPEDAATDAATDADMTQVIRELRDLRTQIRTQQETQAAKSGKIGRTPDANIKKDKNNKILSKESTKVGSSDEQPHIMFPHRGDNKSFIAFAAWITANAPYCANSANWSHGITQAEYERLINRYGYSHNDILRTVAEIENRKDLRKRYSNLYVTTFSWLKQSRNP